MGGSLALALRGRIPAEDIHVWARPASLERTRRALPDCLVTGDLQEAVQGAEVVILCCPVRAMGTLARDMADAIDPNAIVTDAGSVKVPVLETLGPIFGERFIGAHPMAGSERSGIDAASPDLFEGATCILTPAPRAPEPPLRRVREFWESVGCRTIQLGASEHDFLVALASHMPHAVASALAEALGQADPSARAIAGKGLRDTTRIAAGPAGMWTEIFLDNRENLLAALKNFRGALDQLEGLLAEGRQDALEDFLSRAGDVRRSLE